MIGLECIELEWLGLDEWRACFVAFCFARHTSDWNALNWNGLDWANGLHVWLLFVLQDTLLDWNALGWNGLDWTNGVHVSFKNAKCGQSRRHTASYEFLLHNRQGHFRDIARFVSQLLLDSLKKPFFPKKHIFCGDVKDCCVFLEEILKCLRKP